MHCDLMMLSEAVFQIPKVVFTRGLSLVFLLAPHSSFVVVYMERHSNRFQETRNLLLGYSSFYSARRLDTRSMHSKKPWSDGIMQMPIGINCQPHCCLCLLLRVVVCALCVWQCGGPPTSAAAGCRPLPTPGCSLAFWEAWGAPSICEFW